MKAALLLAVLLQAPAAQETPIEDRIAAYLKGDDAARTELLKHGAFAIRPLQKSRASAPVTIDALVFELKKAAAFPKESSLPDLLDVKIAIPVKEASFQDVVNGLPKWTSLPLFFDQLEGGGVKPAHARLELKHGTRRTVLDNFCRQTGLDYGFFHGAVVISRPDRLWPAGPPGRPRELRPEEAARAKEWVEKLRDDSIEVRESASQELLKLGPSIIPILEPNLTGKDSELVARCSDLMAKFKPQPRITFRPAAVDAQKLDPTGTAVMRALQTMRVAIGFERSTLSQVLEYMTEYTGLPFRVKGDAGEKVVTFRSENQNVCALLTLLTQSQGLDFAIQAGGVSIGTPEAIGEILSEKK